MILFEILIGLGLLTLLLSLLFSFFTSNAKMEVKLEKAQKTLLERQHLQNRLQSVLTSIVPRASGEEKASLYTQKIGKEGSQNLAIYFDNGIDPDPAFSGPIVGRIFLDQENRLCLALWPEDRKKNPEFREEILLQNVTAFTFRFLTRTIEDKIVWESDRPKQKRQPLPSIIRLDVWQGIDKKDEPNLNFAFILPSQEPAITYGKKKT
ncbi:MAG: hypothetical protein JSS32_00835 [Verrucomicrobia bacterium]|nr:hypothetical protein [Verrucomicrobiota bacterium]